MQERDMPKADLVTSIVLIAFAVGVVWMSIEMPRLEHRNINPWTVPGLVPGILGVIIGFLGLILLFRSIKQKGYALELTGEKFITWVKKPASKRLWLTVLLTLAYAWGLIGRVPYLLATFLFIFAFIIIFEYNRGENKKKKVKRVVIAFITAGLAAGIVSAVFRYAFLVRLP
ncbi:MAG: hypothetical protein DRP87_16480 [Spirochaetes bacterium]|nr:MAG: hypothetical protein DRP87_16480 [Spirochaetota bacterium]